MNDLFIRTLKDLLSINSVYDATTVTSQRPYGLGVSQALEYMKALALKDGFDVEEYEGHAISITLNPGYPRIDVVSHLDVVEPGEGWTSDPFTPRLQDNKLIARGTEDMKTTALLSYVILKEIRDSKRPLTHTLRVVFGTDEERTMKDMEHYITQAGQPKFAFTPDGYFPLSIGEKGALMWELEGNLDHEGLELNGGVQCNVIAPSCVFSLKDLDETLAAQLIHDLKLNASIQNHQIQITGKAGHASRPDSGHNAIVDALELLSHLTQNQSLQVMYQCFKDPYGRSAGISITHPSMKELTLNLGVLKIHQGKVFAQVDCRYPINTSSEKLSRKLKDQLPFLEISLPYDAKPTLADINNPYVQTLLESYKRHYLDDLEPVISGGVSYCKVFENSVAFGPHWQATGSTAHQKNEGIDIDFINDLYHVYQAAMIALATQKEIP